MIHRVFMLGTFPPPVHGMAQVNESVRDALQCLGAEVIVLDTSAKTLNRAVWPRFKRLFRVLCALIHFGFIALRVQRSSLYMSLSGGYGQAYELLFLFIARLFGLRIFLHHHSFAYLNSVSPLTQLLVNISGKQSTHIVLCECMGNFLRKIYGSSLVVRVISNAATRPKPSGEPVLARKSLETVGYLSNISEEKGIYIFLDIFSALSRSGWMLKGRIAGPFQDDTTKNQVLARVSELPGLEYVGPKYDGQKNDFFDSIDVLIFPSRYANEAEPLTIHEAMSRALPVLAFDRGCIQEIIPNSAGAVLRDADDVVGRSVDILTEWRESPIRIQQTSSSALAAYHNLRELHLAEFSDLCCDIVGCASTATPMSKSFYEEN